MPREMRFVIGRITSIRYRSLASVNVAAQVLLRGMHPKAHPLEAVALWLLGVLIALGTLLWMTGEFAGRLFGGAWPHVRMSEMGSVVASFPRHIGEPADAWPTHARTRHWRRLGRSG